MKRVALILFLLVYLQAQAQTQTGRILGSVIDQITGRPLKGANVFCTELNTGVVTDAEGNFRFTHFPAGIHTLRASFVGFRPVSKSVTVGVEDAVIRFELVSSPLPVADVTVTTLRYATTLREAAVPLAVVTREQLETSAPVTVADALHREPGVTLQRDGIWATSVSIRGLGRSSLVTLIDGNRIDTATDIAAGLAMFDMYDIERIEVIKGAASALYGSGATGGVVNVISRNGWYQENPYWHLRLAGGYSSVNKGGRGHAAVNAGGQNWYAHVSGSLRKAENTHTPDGILTNSQFQDNALSTRLAFKPFRDQEIKLNFQRFYAKDVGIPGAYPVFPSTASVRYPFEKRQLLSVEYSISHFSRFLQQISIKGYNQKIWRDVENFPHTVTSMPASGSQPARKVYALRILPGATHDLNGLQIQGNFFPGQHHLLIAGIDGWEKAYAGYRTKETRIDFLKPDGSVSKSV
ncbi:MAG TPA: TonB-dependent receptor, partial [bacterium]|nr:TonB-dependent receptor [bacterium]